MAVAAVRSTALVPFTIEHFRAWTSNLVLDTGDYWDLEPFQEEVVHPILSGVREVWSILPEGNAKTTLMAGVALYHCDYTRAPWVPIAAASRDQAEILARQAYAMIRSSPGLDRRFRIFEGYREIRSLRNGGRGIKVYAADTMTADGVIPTLAIVDEGHRHPDMALYRLWKGKLKKRNAQIALISTSGEPGSEFEEMRDSIRDSSATRTRVGAHVRYESPGITMNEWMVARAEEVSDMQAVKAANPLSTITVADLRADFASPTTDLGDWKRLKCNIPSRSTKAAVSEVEWDHAESQEEIPMAARVDLGADVAWKHDTFAIVPLYRGEGYHLLGDADILVPPRDGSTLHPDEVKAAFARFFDAYIVDTVVIDMGRAEDIASWLEDEYGVKVIDWSQGNTQQAEDYEVFMRGLREGMKPPEKRTGAALRHTGHSGLRAHVMHAVTRALPGDKRRFDRPSQSRARKKQDERVIDALSAAAMVESYASGEPENKLAGEVEDYRIEELL